MTGQTTDRIVTLLPERRSPTRQVQGSLTNAPDREIGAPQLVRDRSLFLELTFCEYRNDRK